MIQVDNSPVYLSTPALAQVGRAGFEPAAMGLKGPCSARLS